MILSVGARMKKIALIGTHGVGKTTTAYGIGYRLKQMRYDTDILYESARKCPLPINKKRYCRISKMDSWWSIKTRIIDRF